MFDPTLPDMYDALGLTRLDQHIQAAVEKNEERIDPDPSPPIGATTWMLLSGLAKAMEGHSVAFEFASLGEAWAAEKTFSHYAEELGARVKWREVSISLVKLTSGAYAWFGIIPTPHNRPYIQYNDSAWKARALRRAHGWEQMATEARLTNHVWEVFAEDDEFLFSLSNNEDLTPLMDVNKTLNVVVTPPIGVLTNHGRVEPGHQNLSNMPVVQQPSKRSRRKRPPAGR